MNCRKSCRTALKVAVPSKEVESDSPRGETLCLARASPELLQPINAHLLNEYKSISSTKKNVYLNLISCEYSPTATLALPWVQLVFSSMASRSHGHGRMNESVCSLHHSLLCRSGSNVHATVCKYLLLMSPSPVHHRSITGSSLDGRQNQPATCI
jgi:hypothetical protein